MNCATWRELISAALDEEASEAEAAAADRHARSCPSCGMFRSQAAVLRRQARVQVADDVPDLSGEILASATPHRHRRQLARVRAMLAWVGLAQLLLAVPAVVLGAGAVADDHAARHLGAFDAAIGVGLLVAAARPRRAVALLPVLGALCVLIVATALADVAQGATTLAAESVHLVPVVGFGLLWLTAGRPAPRQILRAA